MKSSLLAAMSLIACAVPTLSCAANAAGAASVDREIRPAAPTDAVGFVLHFPLRNAAELDVLIAGQSTPGSPFYHHYLTPSQFRAAYAPDPALVAKAVVALKANGIGAARSSSQLLTARGSAADVERFFSTKLARVANNRSTHLAAVRPILLPASIAGSGATVINLAKRYEARPQMHVLAPIRENRLSPFGPYYFDDLKQAYVAPSYGTAQGRGVRVAIVGVGDFSDADLAGYLQHERVGPLATDLAPAPQTTHDVLPGAAPFSGTSGDSEADLDVQQIAGIAPGADITVIDMPDASDGSFLNAYTAIVENNRYDVVSTSYGLCELFYTAAYNGGVDATGVLRAFEDVFKQGNAQGITFVASSGDNAGLNCPEPAYFNNPPTVPATSYLYLPGISGLSDFPNVTAVGGGSLRTRSTAGSLNSHYAGESGIADFEGPSDPYGTGNVLSNSYFGAGGGESVVFAKPAYQTLVDTHTKMRANPDVGGHIGGLATHSADVLYFNGLHYGVIGTSASAPDFAALVALGVERYGARLGNVNDVLYLEASTNGALPGGFFHEGIPTFNGVVGTPTGRVGYNFVYGVGSPIYKNTILLPTAVPAGLPQTPTNP
ncbi:MAG: S53 family peptidase [Candidatus Eremiobacteraeota bacterium]|nr:S53 family peptidase [Candidatus Eremiobacteraeota bacterium]